MLGIAHPVRSIPDFVHTNDSALSSTPVHHEPEIVHNATEINQLQSVVEEAGWFSWDEYLRLVVTSQSPWGVEGVLSLYEWTDEPNRLTNEIRFLKQLMKEEAIKPFAPIMRKVIQKYLLEVEMKKMHKTAVQKRYRDFRLSGRTLKFGYSDLEQDEHELAGKSNGPVSDSGVKSA